MIATISTKVSVGQLERFISLVIESDENDKSNMKITRFVEENIEPLEVYSTKCQEIWEFDRESPAVIIRHCASLLTELADRIEAKQATP